MSAQLEQWYKDTGTEIKNIWSDTYRMYLKYHGRQLVDNEWTALVNDAGAIMKKYDMDRTSISLTIAVIARIEEENR